MNNKVKLYDKFFFLTYVLFLLYTMCSKVVFMVNFLNIIKYIIPALLLILIFLQSRKYKMNSLLFIILLISLSFVVYLKTHEEALLCSLLFILAAKDIRIEEFIKKDVVYKILILLFIVACFKLGYTTNNLFMRSDGTIRNTLGFVHPNQLGLCIFSICCGLAYIHYDKYKLKDYIIFIISLFICHSVCDSRSSFFGIIIIILFIFFRKIILNKKWFNKIVKPLPWILFTLSLVFTYLYMNHVPIAYEINNIFNSRLYHSSAFLNYYGINLFGHNFAYYGLTNLRYELRGLTILDNAYIHILIHFGLIQTILILLSYSKLLKEAYKSKKYEIYVYLIPFLVYGLMERHIYEIQYNCILLLLSSYIYLKKYEKNKQEETML